MKLSLILAALLIATLLTGAECLRNNHRHLRKLKPSDFKVVSFIHEQYGDGPSDLLSHKDDAEEKIQGFTESDESFLNSVNTNTPLSTDEAQKVQNYFHDHPEIVLDILSDAPNAQDCFGDMTDDQKIKFVLLVIDQSDFTTFTTSQSQVFTDSQLQAIKSGASNDSDLAPYVDNCIVLLKQ